MQTLTRPREEFFHNNETKFNCMPKYVSLAYRRMPATPLESINREMKYQ